MLVALIKQELNSEQLHSSFERMDKLAILITDSKAKTLQINDIVNQISQASDDVMDRLERLNNDSKVKAQQITSLKNMMNHTSDELVNLHLNVTSLNSHSEKLLHDLISQSRADLNDKLENLNDVFGSESENKTSQMNHIHAEIKETSGDLWNLHLKIRNITSSLNKLDQIKGNLLFFLSKENEATRQMLKNISDITFRSFSNQSETEKRQITSSVMKILKSIKGLHQYLGQSLEIMK